MVHVVEHGIFHDGPARCLAAEMLRLYPFTRDRGISRDRPGRRTMTDRDTERPALLVERGADGIDHPGGTLGAHLQRVAVRLADHGVDETARRAGLWHAAYGTDGFPVALVGLDERHLVAAAIGDAAEAEVYRYASCDRAATYPGFAAPIVTFTDRFSGAAAGIPRDELRTFAAITVANELDIVDHLAAEGAPRARLHRLLAPMADLLSPAARNDLNRTLG